MVSAIAYANAHPAASHDTWATVIVIVSLLAMPVLSVWFLWRRDDEGPDDPGSDGGPGGPPPDPPPPPDGPAWWPEFEREFAAHVEMRGRSEQASGRLGRRRPTVGARAPCTSCGLKPGAVRITHVRDRHTRPARRRRLEGAFGARFRA